MTRDSRGVVGDIARVVGGSPVAPPIDPTHIQRYFVDVKGLGAMDERGSIVAGGVPVNAVMSAVDLERALQYGNLRSVTEHLPIVRKKIGEAVRRQKCLVMLKSAAHEIPNPRVSPLAAVVTHKVRIINDLSFDAQSKEKTGGLNKDTDPDAVPQ